MLASPGAAAPSATLDCVSRSPRRPTRRWCATASSGEGSIERRAPGAATLLSPFAPIRCGSPRLTCAGSGVRHDGPSDAQLASYLRALSGGLREDQRHVCGQRQRAGSSVTERATTTPVPAPRQARAPASVPAPRERVAFAGLRPAGERLRVLLVEDDPADAFLVEEQLLEARAPLDIETVATMAQARQRLVGVDCVLLDLRLPDASGLDGLHQVLHAAAGVAVCVLTGYAVERRRADENARQLREAELRQAESARLERGLLPQPLVDPASARVFSFYRPGRHRALLGGDFFDAIESPARRLHLLVGDVCGHGADEAALGAQLRVAWRALVLAGVPDDAMLHSLEQVLVSERRDDEVFATVAMVTVDLDNGTARIRLAGHPPPMLLLGPDRVELCDAAPGLVLGVQPGMPGPTAEVGLADDWALLLYTDGLIEGRAAPDGERLGVEGLRELLADPRRSVLPRHEIPAWLVGEAEERNGEPLADDVAMLLVTGGGR